MMINIKKIIAVTILTIVSSTALALSFDNVQFYGGLDGKYNHFSHEQAYKDAVSVFGESARNEVLGLNLFVGTRLNQNFGLEAGYEFMKNQKFKFTNVDVGHGIRATGAGKTKYANIYVDAIGYIPLDDYLELMVSLGLGRQESKTAFSVTPVGGVFNLPSKLSNSKDHIFGIRVGGGFKYNICPNIAARARLVYQKGGSQSVIKSGTSLSVGVLYTI